jgi:tRNA A-37 threonylcarbamoyl transferase component Bud32
MNPERWKAIGDIFEEALALPAGDRTLHIHRATVGDDELRREVLSLVASHKALPGGFVQDQINNAVVAFYKTSLDGRLPDRIGPYHVLRELGRGGMGTVFLGESNDDARGKVAIKLVRPGMDTEFILARFRRERQTLARMQHPNIARLLDSGSTPEGLPYIVMEYVDGKRITDHIREQRLGVAARLILFLSVCAAVDYAHRNFVIHRDLKPGNILVDSRDTPKLLDFGICKLLADRASDASTETVHGRMMTPSYASPEQIRGDAVTVLSDVYSLGVVLYEVLTDECFSKIDGHSTSRAFRHAQITPPSAAVRERSLKRELSGDLDNILRRALEIDPQQRYQSVASLADDLRRHLLDEPVHARPCTLYYCSTKFIKRSQGVFAILTALLFLFVAPFTIVVVHRHSAHITGLRVAGGGEQQDPDGPPVGIARFRDSTVETEDLLANLQKGNISQQLYRAVSMQQLGDLMMRRGDGIGATKAFLESAAIARANLDSAEPSFLHVFIACSRKLALQAIAEGRRDEALEIVHDILAVPHPKHSAPDVASARALSTAGLLYAELSQSTLRQSDDRRQALGYLQRSVDTWERVQSRKPLSELQEREMRETEEALESIEK